MHAYLAYNHVVYKNLIIPYKELDVTLCCSYAKGRIVKIPVKFVLHFIVHQDQAWCKNVSLTNDSNNQLFGNNSFLIQHADKKSLIDKQLINKKNSETDGLGLVHHSSTYVGWLIQIMNDFI